MPSLLLVRHAQASYGSADYDVLSELGHRQAAVLAADLKRRGLAPDRLVCGTLHRQRDTIAAIAQALGQVPVEEDAGWNEYDSQDILTHHSGGGVQLDGPGAGAVSSHDFQGLLDGALAAWIAAGPDGPAAESWTAFRNRVHGALRSLAGGLGRGQTALVCSSGGAIGTAAAELLGLGETGMITLNRVAINTGVTRVVAGARGMTLVSFNEHGHLDGQDPALRTYR
ncbi:MAG: histidine phosphatase family protein [Solirubrobacterales bacterium]|nr:histidine phosphatase family protein [Solirubrobacterales bacterium]